VECKGGGICPQRLRKKAGPAPAPAKGAEKKAAPTKKEEAPAKKEEAATKKKDDDDEMDLFGDDDED
jgi:ribosomal protein L12E/L44/L45/RPP1/RPP2